MLDILIIQHIVTLTNIYYMYYLIPRILWWIGENLVISNIVSGIHRIRV